MAELELSVKYQSVSKRVGFYVMAAMFPIWSLFVPFLLGSVIMFLIRNPSGIPPELTLASLIVLSAVPILGICLSALFEDNRLYVTKSGIAFPLYLVPFLGFRRHRTWSELTGAGLRRTLQAKDMESDSLYLLFNKTMPLQFRLKNLDKAQLEQMLLAIELWSGSQVRTPELVDYQNKLHNENKGLGKISQVEMFEEELTRRFSATSFVPLEPGKKLLGGSVEIVRQLAFGGLSAIYLAQQNKVNMVVVKEAVVPGDSDQQTKNKAEEHFQREARFLMKLDHPHIAKVIAHFAEEGRDYMLMQYIPGQDLRQLVKQNGAQSQSLVIEWSIRIAEVLQYLHGQEPSVVHRDLTPDNLVLDKNGELILIDFGAANQFVGTATGTLVGKQSYISPEQLRGRATAASDIYSLGGTMHFLLTGADPIPLAVSHPLTIVPGINPELDDLVAELTTFEVTQRLTDLDTIISRLRGIQRNHVRGAESVSGGVS